MDTAPLIVKVTAKACTCSPAFQLALPLAAWHCYKFTHSFWALKWGTAFESLEFGGKKGSGSDIMRSCLSSTLITLTYAWTLWAFVTACGGLQHSDGVCLAVLVPRQQKFLFIYDNFKGEISLKSRTVGERDTVTSSASDGALQNSSQESLTSSHFKTSVEAQFDLIMQLKFRLLKPFPAAIQKKGELSGESSLGFLLLFFFFCSLIV